VTLQISCPDADLDAALELVATLDLLRAPVTAVATGTVGGAAVAVYAAAHDRRAHPHALFVLAEPRVDATGDVESLAVAADQHRHRVAALVARIADACGRPADDVADDVRRGRVLAADEAAGYGLVGTVLAPRHRR
jgi:ATP-dependent Clp protease protease subunit